MNFSQGGGCQCGAVRYEILVRRWWCTPAIASSVSDSRAQPLTRSAQQWVQIPAWFVRHDEKRHVGFGVLPY